MTEPTQDLFNHEQRRYSGASTGSQRSEHEVTIPLPVAMASPSLPARALHMEPVRDITPEEFLSSEIPGMPHSFLSAAMGYSSRPSSSQHRRCSSLSTAYNLQSPALSTSSSLPVTPPQRLGYPTISTMTPPYPLTDMPSREPSIINDIWNTDMLQGCSSTTTSPQQQESPRGRSASDPLVSTPHSQSPTDHPSSPSMAPLNDNGAITDLNYIPKHVQQLNSFTGKVYPCTHPGCDKLFTRKGNMKTHLKTHDPLRDKVFACQYCHRHYYRIHDLIRHEQLHTGNTPFKCPGCKHVFNRRDALRRHVYKSPYCFNWIKAHDKESEI